MLFNEARATALLRAAGVDAIVAAAPLSVDYLTDHRSSFETHVPALPHDPGRRSRAALPVVRAAQRQVASGRCRARRDRLDRPAGMERRTRVLWRRRLRPGGGRGGRPRARSATSLALSPAAAQT